MKCMSTKRRKNGKKDIARLRVRLWGDYPLTQEGWISEVASNGQVLATATMACGHIIYRPNRMCW